MYQVTVDSTEKLIPLADFKEFARITSSVATDEQLMEVLIDGAIKYCEKYTGLSIASKTYQKVWQWKGSCKLWAEYFELRKGVVTSITSIEENYRDGNTDTYDLTGIQIDNYKQRTDVYLNGAYFKLGTHPTRPLVITFVAGWTKATLPNDLRTAIMQLALYWYENRETMQIMDETNIAEMPFGTSTILNIYKLARL